MRAQCRLAKQSSNLLQQPIEGRRSIAITRLDRRPPRRQRLCQQGVAVDFSIGRQGQAFQQKQTVRTHVRRQSRPQMGVEFYVVQTVARHDKRQQLMIFGSLTPGADIRLRHLRVLQNLQLHLARFDAKTAYFYLPINPADVLDQLFGIDPHPITGSVMHLGASVEFGQAYKAAGSVLGSVAIATGDTAATQVQLADFTNRHRPLLLIQHLHASVRQWPTNRYREAVEVPRNRETHRKRGAFGGAVDVEDLAITVRIRPIPGAHGNRADLLATDQHLTQAGEARRKLRAQGVEQRNGHEQVIDPLLFQHPGQTLRIQHVVIGDDHAATAIEQRRPQFETARIEGRIRQAGKTVRWTNLDIALGLGQAQQAPFADLHRFRFAGGARGVEQETHVGESLSQRLRRMVRVVQQRLDARLPKRGCRGPFLIQGNQPHARGIGEHQVPALGRAGTVQRHHHGADFQCAEYRREPLPRTR